MAINQWTDKIEDQLNVKFQQKQNLTNIIDTKVKAEDICNNKLMEEIENRKLEDEKIIEIAVHAEELSSRLGTELMERLKGVEEFAKLQNEELLKNILIKQKEEFSRLWGKFEALNNSIIEQRELINTIDVSKKDPLRDKYTKDETSNCNPDIYNNKTVIESYNNNSVSNEYDKYNMNNENKTTKELYQNYIKKRVELTSETDMNLTNNMILTPKPINDFPTTESYKSNKISKTNNDFKYYHKDTVYNT